MKNLYTLLVGVLLACGSVHSQETMQADSLARGYIIQLNQDANLDFWKAGVQLRKSFPFRVSKVLSKEYKVLLLQEQNGRTSQQWLSLLRNHPDVQRAQLNYPVYLRNGDPSDPFWETQWSLQQIGAQQLWANSNFGRTHQGVPIVLGILEPNGYDVNHEDLHEQIWLNEQEIPLDGEDNDGNSYVDDFMGWNAARNNDDHQGVEAHGTQVAGIASASSNNDIGISSVGWNSKLLLLSGNRYVDEVITNYFYALQLRKRFNRTQGKEGALVVATNASFGTNGNPQDFSIWCEMYNLLGAEGILSVAAADNKSINTDLRSDIPTSCSSDYLITVTGVDQGDQFLSGKAFGPETVDIAAPAEGIVSTYPKNQYREILNGGNSFAAPHITGAVGLLYSLPYPEIQKQAINDPANTALMMKSFLMQGVHKLSSLEGMIKSEGRIDLSGTQTLLNGHFKLKASSLKVESVYPLPFQEGITLALFVPSAETIELEVFNLQGQLVHQASYEANFGGNHQLSLQLDHLNPGMYTLIAKGKNALSSAKMVKLQ